MKNLTIVTAIALLSIPAVGFAQDAPEKEKQPDPVEKAAEQPTEEPTPDPAGEEPTPEVTPEPEAVPEPPAPEPTPAPAAAVVAPTPEPAAAATADAEESKEGKKKAAAKFFSGGLKLGAGMSTVSGDEIEGNELSGYGQRFGPNAGGFLTFRVHENVAVQWEAYFNYKGANVEGGTFRLNYIDMPLLVKGILPIGGKIVPNVHVGPMLSHVQISKVELDEMDREVNLKEDPKEVNTLDFGVAAGVGANYKLSVGEVTADLRFQQGFANVIDLDQCGSCGAGDTIKNRSFLLQVGYVFP